jgi:hypothetical protein
MPCSDATSPMLTRILHVMQRVCHVKNIGARPSVIDPDGAQVKELLWKCSDVGAVRCSSPRRRLECFCFGSTGQKGCQRKRRRKDSCFCRAISITTCLAGIITLSSKFQGYACECGQHMTLVTLPRASYEPLTKPRLRRRPIRLTVTLVTASCRLCA